MRNRRREKALKFPLLFTDTCPVEVSCDFSLPFREQVARWLERMPPPRAGERVRVFTTGQTRVVVADELDCPDGFASNDVLVVRGDLRCGARTHLAGPVFVGGECEIGKQSRLMAVAAGHRLVLGAAVQVSDWADAEGVVEARAGVSVGGALASRTSIQLGEGAGAAVLFAPGIMAGGAPPAPPLELASSKLIAWEAPHKRQNLEEWEGGLAYGFKAAKLTALGADTWLYDGSLQFTAPVLLRTKLVVRGSFRCAANSLLEDDIKTGADLTIGTRSIANGQLTAKGNLTLGAGTWFSGDLRAELNMRLRSGVRGFRQGGPVHVECTGRIQLEPGALIRGSIKSAQTARACAAGEPSGLDLLLAEA